MCSLSIVRFAAIRRREEHRRAYYQYHTENYTNKRKLIKRKGKRENLKIIDKHIVF
jgi:hypothetical protein